MVKKVKQGYREDVQGTCRVGEPPSPAPGKAMPSRDRKEAASSDSMARTASLCLSVQAAPPFLVPSLAISLQEGHIILLHFLLICEWGGFRAV